MLTTVLVVASILLGLLGVAFVLKKRRLAGGGGADDERSAAVEAWLASALAEDLASSVASLAGERERVRASLRGDPDPTIVSAIEAGVRGVELEYLRYPHEEHVDVIAHVRYEGGKSSDVRGKIAKGDLPAAVSRELDAKATMRVFRPWVFPWSASRAS
jgi:hypothetical protein